MSYQSEMLGVLRNEFGHKATQEWLYTKNRHLRHRRPFDVMKNRKSDQLVWNAAWEWLKTSSGDKPQ